MKVDPNIIVYGLYSSGSPSEIRYVGQTINIKTRMYGHLHAAKTGKKQPVYCWIRKTWGQGHNVEVKILVQNAIYNTSEMEMIDRLRGKHRLLNATSGGLGALGRVVEEATKEKISAANTGKKRIQEVIDNYKRWRRSWRPPSPSEKSREKMSKAKLGKTSWAKGMKNRWSDSEKARIGQQSRERIMENGHPLLGRQLSQETKDKISKSLTGKKLPEWVKQKMRAAHARRRTNG